MKRISSLFLILLSFSSCEKDDICDATTASTPRIVIEFYNTATTPIVRNVTNLKVVGEGIANYYLFNTVSKIKLPLKTSADVTKFSFIINSTDSATQNEDLIELNYTRKNVFISRACGFKTLYYLNATNPLLLTDSVVNDGNWIQNITIETSNIETENETHIKIYY